jgi:RND superfamily putative drug exporter
MLRLAHWTLAHRRAVLLGWVALVIVLTPVAGDLSKRVTPGGFESSSTEAARADALLQKRFKASNLGVVVEQRGSPRPEDAAREIGRIERGLHRLPGVEQVAPSPSRARGVSLLSITVGGGTDGSMKAARGLLAVSKSLSRDRVRVLPVGFGVFHIAGTDIAQKDMTRARWLSSLLLLAVLLFAFGTVGAAAGPIVVGWTSVTISLGLLALVSHLAPLSDLVSNGVAMIATALSVDYMLFMISRFREYRAAGEERREAVIATMATSGRAVFFAGAVIVVALGALFLADTRAVRSMALGMMIAAVVSVATALVVAPALISLADRWLLAPHGRIKRRDVSESSPFWERWSRRVVARPLVYLLPALAALLAFSIPTLHAASSVRLPGPDILPRGNDVRQGYELAARAFGPGALSPIQVVVDPVAGRDPSAQKRAVATLVGKLRADPRVASVQPIPLPDGAARQRIAGGVGGLAVASRAGPYEKATSDLVGDIRSGRFTSGAAPPLLVGGEPAVARDSTATLFDALPPVLAVLFGATFLMLMIAFRSVLIAAKAVVMTVITLGSTFGILLLLFETHTGTKLLGLPEVGLSPVLPVPVIALAFAIGTDYEVIVLSRIRERYLESGDTAESITYGLARTSRIITSAALVMIVVFFSFSAGALVPVKHLAFGLGIAVLVDVTLVRLVLVPATMKLLGDANWWLPGWLERLLPGGGTGRSAQRVRGEGSVSALGRP